MLFHMLYSSSNKILMCFYKIAFIFNEQSVFFISFIKKKDNLNPVFVLAYKSLQPECCWMALLCTGTVIA